MMTMTAEIIHVTIRRNWREVYSFAGNPENMPVWASGLADGLTREGEDWVADGGPIGKVTIRVTPENDLGVIDHLVILENGTEVQNALRVVPNGEGAEVMFTLLHQPGMDDAAFAADAAHILKDLQTLKALLER